MSSSERHRPAPKAERLKHSPARAAQVASRAARSASTVTQQAARASFKATQHVAQASLGESRSLLARINRVLNPPRYEDKRLEYFNTRADLPLALAAVVFLVAYALPIAYPDLDARLIYWCFWAQTFIWGLFILQYAVSLLIAERKWNFIRYHLFDLALVTLPFFGPLRLLRLLFLLEVLNRHSRNSMRGKLALYATVGSAIVIIMGALAELQVERGVEGSGFKGFGSALWWAIVTVTTVGYGDIVPVTSEGRVVAVFLMLGGVTLMGMVTAVISTWLADSIGTQRQLQQKRRDRQKVHYLETLLSEVKSLNEQVESLSLQVEKLRAEVAERGEKR